MNNSSEQLAKRLLLMTLALEEAVSKDVWHEVDILFVQRERIIAQLEASTLDAKALRVIGEVKAVDDRIAATLESGKQDVLSSLQANSQCRKAARAYKQNGAIGKLDRAS